jgi:hypothetical protein
MPRLDAPTPVLARYIMTEDFQKQPFDMQAQFMKVLDTRNKRDKTDPNKGKELDKAYAAGGMSETEYRAALQMAWFGKHPARVDRYSAQGGSQKQAYLNELILESIKEKELEKTNPKPPKEMTSAASIRAEGAAPIDVAASQGKMVSVSKRSRPQENLKRRAKTGPAAAKAQV